MIICGYPGIGKTTLCKNCKDFIDLESSIYYNEDGKTRPDGWQQMYVNTALWLSRDGYDIFMSCHEGVRELLADACEKDPNLIVFVIAPHPAFKQQWIRKLMNRAMTEGTEIAIRAYEWVPKTFNDDIESIIAGRLPYILINDLNYDLTDIHDDLEYIWMYGKKDPAVNGMGYTIQLRGRKE